MEAIFNRIIAIIESGTYAGASLGFTGLRTFPDVMQNQCVLILPRGDSGWTQESGSTRHTTTLSYDLYFYVQEALIGKDAIGIADASNFNTLATKIFLSRPQLQLLGQTDIGEISGSITWQTTSNLATPIPYPLNGISTQQGARYYWGFVIRLTVPYRFHIDYLPLG